MKTYYSYGNEVLELSNSRLKPIFASANDDK